MAFGTPTDGGAAYSANGGSTVTPAYPASIAANDILVLIIGQKPSTANGGTVTTPTGWTLRESITGQGGYGTTLGADTGNTNLFVYTKDTVAGTETGSLSVTVGTNNVCWGLIMRIPGGGSTSESFGSADGGRATAPTSAVAFTNLLTNGATAPNFQAGDLAIWAMCIPTDVLGGTGFSAPTISATGATFATPTETEEPSSGTGNDIGGFVAYAAVTAGTSTAAPTVGATATGTVTNVRGPLVLLRIRDTTQKLTPSLYTNANSFFSPTITQTAPTQNLSPARYDNTNTFYPLDITQTGGTQTLTPALYTNTNSFFAQTITSANTISPALYTNANVFYSATVTAGTITLSPARYDNLNVFYSPVITQTGGPQTLLPDLYTNTNSFFTQVVTAANTLSPSLYTNTNSFYTQIVTSTALISPQLFTNTNQFFSPDVAAASAILPALYENQNVFYQPTVSSAITLLPDRYDNTNVFYSPSVSRGETISPDLYVNTNAFYQVSTTYGISTQPYVDPGYVDDWYVGLNLQNVSQFFSPTVTIQSMSSGNMFLLFFP